MNYIHLFSNTKIILFIIFVKKTVPKKANVRDDAGALWFCFCKGQNERTRTGIWRSCEMLPGTPTSHGQVPTSESQLHSWLQLPADVHPERQLISLGPHHSPEKSARVPGSAL